MPTAQTMSPVNEDVKNSHGRMTAAPEVGPNDVDYLWSTTDRDSIAPGDGKDMPPVGEQRRKLLQL
jgi:hypothetical protein